MYIEKNTHQIRLFPTCQVRVVRFYQSCSPPPPPPPSPPPPPVSPRPYLHQLPPPLPPCQLFAKLFANFPAQCALLDLNLGPSQLSAHRWTSTWGLPSSVRTAGPQPGTFPAQCAPLDLKSQIECQKICQIECQIECQIKCQIECQKICQIKCQNVCQIECQKIWVDNMPEDMPDRMPEDMPDRMPEDMSDRMPEDLPVTTCTYVRVGITRNKVIRTLDIQIDGSFFHQIDSLMSLIDIG